MTTTQERIMIPSTKYHEVHTRFEVLAADGTQLNWGWSLREAADRDAARHAGARVVEHTYETEVCASDRVLIDSGIPESEWSLIRADARRALNMTADAGRPSDATRSAVAAYKAGHLTEESFAAARPSGYYPEDAS